MLRLFSKIKINSLSSLNASTSQLALCSPRILTAQITDTRSFHQSIASLQKKMISVSFVSRDGVLSTVKGKVGDTFLDVAVNNDVDLEGFGACEGTLSCSTCHLVFKKEDFERLPDTPSDEELDMLDLAFGLTDTSRLGCQVVVEEWMEGIVVKVPAQVNDARNR